MRFSDDGVPSAEMRTEDPAMILASIRHRIRMLGGSLQFFSDEAGATVLTVSMPLSNIVSA
jgi:signal transduction histidine kinase